MQQPAVIKTIIGPPATTLFGRCLHYPGLILDRQYPCPASADNTKSVRSYGRMLKMEQQGFPAHFSHNDYSTRSS